jgi:hypothetical protein
MTVAMNYLERLLRRALAVPGAVVQDVFDPFDQVAPWVIEPGAAERALPVQPAPEQIVLPEPAGASDLLAVAAPLQAVPASTDGVAAPHAHAAARPPAPLPVPAAADVTAPLAAGPVAVSRAAQPQPLARADAFMQSLGVAPSAPLEAGAARTAPGPATQAHSEPQPAPPALRATMTKQQPVLPSLRPPAPLRPPPAVATPAAARRRTAPAASSAAAPANTPRPAPAAPRERIVQTTVFVTPAPRALDDLAHSSGIARFGIGQS